MVHPKMKIVFLHSPSCRSKPEHKRYLEKPNSWWVNYKMFIFGWTIPSSLEANLAIFKCFSQGTKLDLKQMNNLISYTWSTRQWPPNPKPMFYCHSSCLDEGYVPNTVGKLPTCNLQLQHTCLLLSRAPGDLNYLVQLCLFRVGTELCRKVDHQEQDWAHLV